MPPVHAPEAKLAHAGEQLQKVERFVAAFLAEKPSDLVYEIAPDRRSHSVFMEISKASPDRNLGPLIGDVLNNTGSALDAMAWELACLQATPELPEGRVRFPINPVDDPKARRKLGTALKAFPEEARSIIEVVQPSDPDGERALWILDELWRYDKHRGIPRTGPYMRTPGGGGSYHGDLDDREPPYRREMSGGSGPQPTPEGWTPLDSYPDNYEWDLCFVVPPGVLAIPGVTPYAGQLVVPTLREIVGVAKRRVVSPLRKVADRLCADAAERGAS